MTVAILIPIIFIIFVFISIQVGIFVYRDASRRDMNAMLWALVAVCAPSLIGFIIYILVRGNYSNLRCPECNTVVQDHFVICPKCGTKLQASCPNCSEPVKSDWKLCPKCTQPLPDTQSDVKAPNRSRDNTLGKIAIALVIIPILIIAILVVSYIFTSDKGGYSEIGETSITEVNDLVYKAEIEEWLSEVGNDQNYAYALQYSQKTTADTLEYFYLIYAPGYKLGGGQGLGKKGEARSETLIVELYGDDTLTDDAIIFVSSTSDKVLKLKIMLNGKELPCEVTEVEYNPLKFNDGELPTTSKKIEQGETK